jgi:hypothetical protein
MHAIKALLLLALSSVAVAAPPAYVTVRYSFTTDPMFGAQHTVSGVVRYKLKQEDQRTETVAGLYDLVSHRAEVDGIKTAESPDPLGSFTSSFETVDAPYIDMFSFGSTFNTEFSAGTLTSIRLFGLDESGQTLSSDRLFAMDASVWPELQGSMQYIPTGGTQATAIFGYGPAVTISTR